MFETLSPPNENVTFVRIGLLFHVTAGWQEAISSFMQGKMANPAASPFRDLKSLRDEFNDKITICDYR